MRWGFIGHRMDLAFAPSYTGSHRGLLSTGMTGSVYCGCCVFSRQGTIKGDHLGFSGDPGKL